MELLISIDRDAGRPLQTQLYESIRSMILNGTLKAGHRLPSTRSIAEQLQLGRNTVVLAYERLIIEDYLVPRGRSGYFVNDKLPEVAVLIQNPTAANIGPCDQAHPLSRMMPFSPTHKLQLWQDRSTRPEFDLFVGRPHPKSFPYRFWRRSLSKHSSRINNLQTEYDNPLGLVTLRKAIAEHLRATRGVVCTPEQVLITAGIQGALNVLARLFVGGCDKLPVATENPCYQGAALLFSSYGATLYPVPVDNQGMVVSELEHFKGNLVYVTPSHQFPTGYTLSLDRRLHLLDWSYRTGSYVIEDDYDSDFRYDGPPITALAGLDRRNRVIYLGTYSKSIGAGLRIGYAILPSQLVEHAATIKGLSDNGAPWFEQVVIADFLNEGEFMRHLRRIRRLYKSARDALVETIMHHFPGSTILGSEAGMHLMWELPPWMPDATETARFASSRSIGLYTVSSAAGFDYGQKSRYTERCLVLGYTGLAPDQLQTAITRVAGIHELQL